MIQARHGKALHALAKEFGIGIRAIRTWLRLQACCGCQALGQQPQPGRPPCLSPDPMRMILATLRDKSPDQLQFEFAYRSLKIVRPGILDQFPVQLSLSTVRRVLRRLGLTPQRPQFRAYQQNAAVVRTWIAATCPALARHAQEQGALLLWADEAGRTSHSHRGTPWAPRGRTPVVQPTGERFRLNRLSASSPSGAIHYMIHSGTATADAFEKFLQQIPDQTEARPIHVIVDRHSIPTSKPGRSGARHRWRFIYCRRTLRNGTLRSQSGRSSSAGRGSCWPGRFVSSGSAGSRLCKPSRPTPPRCRGSSARPTAPILFLVVLCNDLWQNQHPGI